MNAVQLQHIDENLQCLRLFKSRERLEALLQQAATEELSYAEFLDTVLGEEVQAKTAKNITMRTNLARFPFVKGLDAFDFAYQPSIDKKQFTRLSNCHFIEHDQNLVILGPPGVGKTHLAVGLGPQRAPGGVPLTTQTRRLRARWPPGGADPRPGPRRPGMSGSLSA